MMSPPDGPALSTSRAQLLDDEFFGSDPHAYFRSRIAMLTNAGAPTTPSERSALRDDFLAAVTLRHHAAEAVVRLYHSLAVAANGEALYTYPQVSTLPLALAIRVRIPPVVRSSLRDDAVSHHPSRSRPYRR